MLCHSAEEAVKQDVSGTYVDWLKKARSWEAGRELGPLRGTPEGHKLIAFAYVAAGSAASANGDREQARDCWQRALHLLAAAAEDDWVVQHLQGEALRGLDRPDEALSRYLQALELASREPEESLLALYAGLAEAHRMLGHWQEYLHWYRAANPGQPPPEETVDQFLWLGF